MKKVSAFKRIMLIILGKSYQKVKCIIALNYFVWVMLEIQNFLQKFYKLFYKILTNWWCGDLRIGKWKNEVNCGFRWKPIKNWKYQ